MPPFRTALLLLLFTGLHLVARAHLVGERSLVLSADSENLEAMVSMPLASAALLLPEGSDPLDAATFDRLRPALVAAASRVATLLDGTEHPIAPQRVLVAFFEQHEVRFHLLYPPDTQPARLHVPGLGAPGGDVLCVVTDLRKSPPLRASLTAKNAELVFTAPKP